MTKFPTTWTLLLLAFLCTVPSDSVSAGSHDVIVFVQGTPYPKANRHILVRYAWPVVQALENSGLSFELTMFPITADTSTSSSFFSTGFDKTLAGRKRLATDMKRFRDLGKALDGIYGNGESVLVDLLGSVFVVDEALGLASKEELSMMDRVRGFRKRTFLIYISDMVQRSGFDGFDFTPYGDGRSLEECIEKAPALYGDQVHFHSEFKDLEILFVRLDLRRLHQEVELPAPPDPGKMDHIIGFWREDFFHGIFGVAPHRLSVSRDKDPAKDLKDFFSGGSGQ